MAHSAAVGHGPLDLTELDPPVPEKEKQQDAQFRHR